MRWFLSLTTLVVVLACSPSPQHPTAQISPQPGPEPRGDAPEVAFLDPALLAELESQGFSLAQLVAGEDATSQAELAQLPALASVIETLTNDLDDVLERNPKARVTAVEGRRLFDARWLASSEMTFVLSGIFNRIDRRAFYEGTCGELRFLYRLGYTTKHGGETMSARLPMTVNLVFMIDAEDDEDCQAAARAFVAPQEGPTASWLVTRGPLAPDFRKRLSLKSLETNLQTLRWQSTMNPNLAGHVEYELRVFHPNAKGTFSPAPLENTPNVRKLRRDKELRKELLEYISHPDRLAHVDRGTLVLPERFLDDHALSAASRGLARLANRPWLQLFDEDDFAALDLSGYATIRTPAALLRRLDAASCQGCHQSRSIAGFHHLGAEPDARIFNGLFSGKSTHLSGDLERRRTYLAEVAAGNAPSEHRPFPERQGTSGAGAPCGLGDAGFADWTCDAGTTCTALEDPQVGTCLVEGASGNPCEYGTLHSKRQPHKDRVQDIREVDCGEGQWCNTNIQAFPQGMCGQDCDDADPDTVCGLFLDIDPFQKCLRQKNAYASCAEEHTYPASLPVCDDTRACRSDYVCVRTPEDPERGGCMPTYFVFQLRTDGYPLRK